MRRSLTNPEVTLRDVYDSISDLREEIAKSYVSKDEFAPVKSIAYGLVGLIVVAVCTALITSVVKAK